MGILGECKGEIERAGDKFAFVQTKKYGKVFVLRQHLKKYREGQTVKLTVFKTEDGKVQGKDLKSGLKEGGSHPGGGKGGRGKHWSGGGADGGMRDMLAMMMAMSGKGGGKGGRLGIMKQPKDTSGTRLGQCKGEIDRAGDKYAFVQTEKYGKVFVLRQHLKKYREGQTVKLTVFKTKEGKVQGRDLISGLKSGGGKNQGGGKPFSRGAHFGSQFGFAKMFMSGYSGVKKQPKDTSGIRLGQCKGEIERAGDKFAFVQTEKYGKVFVLRQHLRKYKEGQTVKLTVYKTKEGKVQGRDLMSGLK